MRLTLFYVAVHRGRLVPAVLVLIWRRHGWRTARMTAMGERWAALPDLLRAARAWRP